MRRPSLTLVKTWSGAIVNDAINFTATGLTTFASVANTSSETDTASAQPVSVGAAITLAETFTTGSAANYNSVLTCSGNATALAGNVLTVECRGYGDNVYTDEYICSCTIADDREIRGELEHRCRWQRGDQPRRHLDLYGHDDQHRQCELDRGDGERCAVNGEHDYVSDGSASSDLCVDGYACGDGGGSDGGSGGQYGQHDQHANPESTNSNTVTTPVRIIALTITKTASTANFTVGTAASYNLSVQNIGSAATTAVSTISDTIPTGLTIGSLPAGCSAAGE